MRNRNRALAGLGLLTSAILAACSGGNATAPDCDAIAAALVSRIEVRPATTTLNIGDSLQMHAVAFSCAGQLGEVGGFQWRSSDGSIIAVSSTGLLKAMKTGVAYIYAAARGKEGSATVTAQLPPVARVTVEPASATLGVGRTSTLTARAFDSHGRELLGRTTTWSSADPAVVAVDAHGGITGVSVGGPVTVTATIEGKTGSSRIKVVLVPVNTVVITPPIDTIPAGATVQLSATLRDDLNNVLTGRAVHWGSSDPTIASVTAAGGLVQGIKPGTVTVTATSEGKSGTAQITVTTGGPAKLAFVQQPSAVQAGAVISPAVTAVIEDASGNLVTGATSPVTVALAAAGSATLGGTLTVNAVNGVATFSDLTVSAAGSYALTVASAGLTGATSAAFQVTSRPAVRLAFAREPASAVAGTSIDTVTVELQDETGTRVTSPATEITLAIGANPGGGTLSGTLIHTTENGLATFVGLQIDRSGTGYTLAASASGLGGAVSDGFDIAAGPAAQLAFVVQPCPAGCQTGVTLTPAPQVAVNDALGNTVTGSTATVILTLQGAAGATSLSGTTSVQAVAGVATFPDLTVSGPATGLTLRAESGPIASAVSAAFDIFGTTPQLIFSTQPPPSAVAGVTLPPVRVQLKDAQGGNLAVAGVPVTITLGPSGTIIGTLTRSTDANGVATFDDLMMDSRAGTGFTLTATATGYTTAVSDAFAITVGVVAELTFKQQPPAIVAVDKSISPAVAVQLRDAGGHLVRQGGVTITLTVSGGGTLKNASVTTDINGAAAFEGLKVDARAGAGYTLTAHSGGLSVTSDPFEVVK
jgi:uncharacterized protein YjdB